MGKTEKRTKEELGVEVLELLLNYAGSGANFRKTLFDLMNAAVADAAQCNSLGDRNYIKELSSFYWNMNLIVEELEEYEHIKEITSK